MTLHHRRSFRLSCYDYSTVGAYFITIVTWNREPIFGKINYDEMQLSEPGEVAEGEWKRLESRFSQVQLDEFIVMSDHIHGILLITDRLTKDNLLMEPVGAGQEKPIRSLMQSGAPPFPSHSSIRPIPPHHDALCAFVRAYKSSTVRLINGLHHTFGSPVWQRNYYEHIIRNEHEWDLCRAYIQINPVNWGRDKENPDFG